ncbi:MAG: antibiotic biosynthesis monooxygenase [Gammaproteobacteria bacterium]|nr:antibiotic biosynthesis monooxygenase [Gammaproteobacteria bacterium]
MYVVIVEFTIHAAHFEDFVTRVRQQAENSLRQETDCHQFDVCINPEQDNRLLLYEVYTDRSAFDGHLASAHFHDFNTAVRDWVSEKKISTYLRIQD